jgi:hypothetical protein
MMCARSPGGFFQVVPPRRAVPTKMPIRNYAATKTAYCARLPLHSTNEFRNMATKGDFGETTPYKNDGRPFKRNNVGLLDSEDVTGIYFKRLQRRKNKVQK